MANTKDHTAQAQSAKMKNVASVDSVLAVGAEEGTMEQDVKAAWAAAAASKLGATADASAKLLAVLEAGPVLVALEKTSVLAILEAALNDTNKKTAAAREAACQTISGICTLAGAQAEPLFVPLMQAVLKCVGDNAKFVQTAANAALKSVVAILCPHVFKVVLPSLIKAMDAANKWQTVVSACEILEGVAKSTDFTVQETVRASMPDAVPAILPLMTDFKPEVSKASAACMEACMGLVANRDLEPLLPVVFEAFKDSAKRSECVQTLASTTFVSTVNAAALAVIMPFLVSGFREKTTAVKRQCAKIVVNMLKLVEDPSEAKSFLPVLLPTMEKQMNEVSDPEARGVCEQGHAQIVRLQKEIDAQPAGATTETRSARFLDIIKADSQGLKVNAFNTKALNYVCMLCDTLVVANCFDKKEWELCVVPYLKEYVSNGQAVAEKLMAVSLQEFAVKSEGEQEAEDAEELCNCKFTLAYGSKILLHNTEMRLHRGMRYGLLGGNDSGKTTLLRAISNEQVDGFPPRSELRTVFVEADIQGEMSHLSCLDYIFEDPRIQACGASRDQVKEVMATVGFTEDGKARPNDPVSSLSGGWRMKLALARAMLQNADILLLDEPTNHLDVINVEWVMNYLKGLENVTSVIVSHDKKLLDQVCTHMLHITDLKLKGMKGNLAAFVEKYPSAMTYFDYKATKLSFKFPQPGVIEGIKSKGKPLIKMDKVSFAYPGNTKPTVMDITVRASLASRVACVGVNGAGKSTMIKLLTGELTPSEGTVWKHPACRLGYIAQHAFHHIEQHLNKTPNEYIRWRYESGEDKETLDKVTFVITDEEQKKCAEPIAFETTNDAGKTIKEKRVIEKLTGARRAAKKEHEYEVKWENKTMDHNVYLSTAALTAYGWAKHMKKIDEKEALRAGKYVRPLTKANVEEHLENIGLDREYGTHHRMSALSGGQKVKVVMAASLWNQPHILILDEPTNYLDRESLGALAEAIRGYDGGVIMITHNNDFCSDLCPETWVLEAGRLDCRGDPEWMQNAMKEKVEEIKPMEDLTDALGNKVKVKSKKKLSNKEQKAKAKARAFKLANGLEVSSDEEW